MMTYALIRLLHRSRRNLNPKCLDFGNGGASSGLMRIHKPYIRRFSTGYTSVHGDRPSSEYAKLRKESLESEFGQIVGSRSKTSFTYQQFGPFLALYRGAIILFQVAKLTAWHIFVHDTQSRAVKFRETLIRLGPFYIKLGQALSTRPDILPKAYCQELSKLQEQGCSLQLGYHHSLMFHASRTKYHHFRLTLLSNQLSLNWVHQFRNFFLISAQNLLQQHPWDKYIK